MAGNANSGRKKISEEIGTRGIAIGAIIKKFGSLEDGMQYLLETGEPRLTMFVFEHAMGKPTEKIEHSGNQIVPILFKLDERYTEDSQDNASISEEPSGI